jgi:hypothetical protein
MQTISFKHQGTARAATLAIFLFVAEIIRNASEMW